MKRREAAQPKPNPPSDPAPPDTLGERDGVSFQRERLAPVLRELLPLLEHDWRENGIDHDKVPLKFDLDRYLQYDLVGILQVVTARDDGVLVGYALMYVHPHIDHTGMGWAIITWYWLYPEYRKRGIGSAMMDAVENFLRAASVSVVEASEKITRTHGLFQRRGYTPTDTVYRKLLEK